MKNHEKNYIFILWYHRKLKQVYRKKDIHLVPQCFTVITKCSLLNGLQLIRSLVDYANVRYYTASFLFVQLIAVAQKLETRKN